MRKLYTIWELRSPAAEIIVRKAEESTYGETKLQHYFQRIVGHVMAYSKMEALLTVKEPV